MDLKKKNELFLNTRSGIKEAMVKFEKLWRDAYHRDLKLINTTSVIGDHIYNSRNCYNVFDLEGEFQNIKYANWGSRGCNDAYDVGPGCGGKSELTYEGISIGVNNSRCFFGAIIWYSSDIFYSFMMNNCQNCFGCTEMNGKKYCILNKQYSKEEYEKLIPRIKQHMNEMPYIDKKGIIYKYGEFFPPELSPFAYNETVAQDYFPIDKKVAEDNGFLWREYIPGSYKVTINGKDLPQTISEVNDSILDQVIECEVTGKPFKIIEQELNFYRRFSLPLPSIHPDERHNRRLKLRNPMVLNERQCFFGKEKIITTYPPEPKGPRKVLCSEHYKEKIY